MAHFEHVSITYIVSAQFTFMNNIKLIDWQNETSPYNTVHKSKAKKKNIPTQYFHKNILSNKTKTLPKLYYNTLCYSLINKLSLANVAGKWRQTWQWHDVDSDVTLTRRWRRGADGREYNEIVTFERLKVWEVSELRDNSSNYSNNIINSKK